jgi:hypothetical protein
VAHGDIKENAGDGTGLRSFYEACGLDPKTIERAIELRYSELTEDLSEALRPCQADAARANRTRMRKAK